MNLVSNHVALLDERESCEHIATLASIAPSEQHSVQAGGWQITLNDRALKTPARQPLIVPSHQLAVAIAAEWEWQVTS